MDRLKSITLLISVVALGIAAYALVSINRNQSKVITTEKINMDSTQSERRRIQAGSSGIFIERNRLGGDGAVELRRGNRLDVFGGLEERLFVPPDYFDLTPPDEGAANSLDVTLVVPSSVQPFRDFKISYKVTGTLDALLRVDSFQLNVFNYGPIFDLSAEPILTTDGWMVTDTVTTSMWETGDVKLWAHFESGLAELKVTEVTVDLSGCLEERLSLPIPTLLFQTDGATRFVEAVQEEAGEDVTVSVHTDAVATFSHDGFIFHMDIKLEEPGTTIIVNLGMQFMIVAKAGHLGASFLSPGYRSVDIDADLPWYDDAWHTITLGEHNLSSYYGQFRDGLKALADSFAFAIGNQVRGLPDPDDPNSDYDMLEAEAPKVVATRIDMSSEELVVTLCPITSRLVFVNGIFPEAAIKFGQ